jgi:hypothetical protein
MDLDWLKGNPIANRNQLKNRDLTKEEMAKSRQMVKFCTTFGQIF